MKAVIAVFLVLFLSLPVSALEIEPPSVPESARHLMPEKETTFPESLIRMIQQAVRTMDPDLREASRVSLGLIAAVLLVSLLNTLSDSVKGLGEIAGTVAVATMLLMNTNSMVHLASDTIISIGEYGKLLLPVMTAGLAAQGGVTTSSALCAGTAMFHALLQTAISGFLMPGVYLYLALCIGGSALGEKTLKNLADLMKGILGWSLKMLLMLFTTGLSLTGVVSGSTDAVALKAAKVTMSTVVPMVGSVLSDASEAVLVSAGVMKNAAGIYGILAVLALFLQPFMRIGIQYLMLKLTAGFCGVFGSSRVTMMLDSFATAMGLLLAMTGSGCIMVLISTVCFMKGVL